MSLRSQFEALDATLASATPPVPPATKWWRDGIGEWLDKYQDEHVLELWACAGRGSAKSTLLYKLALFFCLVGAFEIPAGEVHYAVILSRLKGEAEKAIGIIDHWLNILGVPHSVTGEVIELTGRRRGIRIAAASVAAASGWRAFFVGLDERSKWPESGVEEVDAGEIETSAGAMTATHEYAPKVVVGSAFGKFGTYYDAIVSGTDASKVVLGPAATWTVAPHISEASCRRKEPRNDAQFKREYACIFQAGAGSSLNDEDVRAAIRPLPEGCEPASAPIILTDPSSGKNDSWTWCLARWVREPSTADGFIYCDIVQRNGERITVRQPDRLDTDLLIHQRCMVSRDPKTHEPERDPDYFESDMRGMRIVISNMDGAHGKFGQRFGSGTVLDKIAKLARDMGVRRVFGDSYSQYVLTESMGRRGLDFTGIDWLNSNKVGAVAHLRSWLRSGTLIVEPGEEAEALRKECLIFQERLAPSGYTTFGARSGGHDDRVSLLLLASLLDCMGTFMGAGGVGSPMKRPNYRHEVGNPQSRAHESPFIDWANMGLR